MSLCILLAPLNWVPVTFSSRSSITQFAQDIAVTTCLEQTFRSGVMPNRQYSSGQLNTIPISDEMATDSVLYMCISYSWYSLVMHYHAFAIQLISLLCSLLWLWRSARQSIYDRKWLRMEDLRSILPCGEAFAKVYQLDCICIRWQKLEQWTRHRVSWYNQYPWRSVHEASLALMRVEVK